jgi:peptide deformylase
MDTTFTIAQIGEPILRQSALPVDDFGCNQLHEFIDKLLNSMINAGGVGIAAPQVFNPSQIMIIASKPNARYPNAPQMEPLVMLNPQIERLYGNLVNDWEGCLSVPGIRGYVERHDCVDVLYQDSNGERHHVKFSGFVARIFQHEHDHLVGLTFVDRVKTNRHLVAELVLKKIISGELPFDI